MATYGQFDPATDSKDAQKEGALQRPQRRMPGRGALDGIKQDLKAAKEGGEAYDPRAVGSAWSHSFLQKKPWHPLTFRNMAVVYEKEQQHYEEAKARADSKAEFDAEQAYLRSLSMLSPEEQEKYRQRQSVSWLYAKPPGYDAALERAEKAVAAGATVGPGGEALPPGQQPAAAAQGAQQQQGQQGGQQGQQRARPVPGTGSHLGNVLQGIAAVTAQRHTLQLKHAPGARSPPRGGAPLSDACQQYVVADMPSDEEEEALRLAAMPPGERERLRKAAARERRHAQKAAAAAQLDQAKAFLRAAGLALPSDDEGGGGGGSSSGSDSDSGSEGEGGGGRRRRPKEGEGKKKRSRGDRKRRRKEKKKKKRRRHGD